MKISISVPEGLELPEDAQEGSTFDLVANCKLENGMLVIEAIEGVPVAQESEEGEEGEGEEEGESEKVGPDENGMVMAPSRQSFLAAVEEKLKSVA